MEHYYTLKKDIERLITKGYLNQFVKGHAHMKRDRENPSQLAQALLEINVILGGTLAGGDTSNEKRKYEKQVLIMAH